MATTLNPTAPPPARTHTALSTLGLLALLASALFGGNVAGVREHFLGSETPKERPVAGGRTAGGSGEPTAPSEPQRTLLRSQPWWQGVGTLYGSGTMTTAPVAVDAGALQARLKWNCQTGHLVVRTADRPKPIIDAACPGSGEGYTIDKGSVAFQVTADGPWQLQVDQELDVPLVEPPLPAMSADGASVAATGSLYRVDQVGEGTVKLYRLADGSYALRLENVFVTANVDLELRFSPLDAPHSTEQFTANPSVWVAPLDITAGSLNFSVPPQVNPTQYRSLVVWCPIVNSAYAAATLK